jgi:hypothetical protein
MFNELGQVSNNIRNIKVNVQNKNEVFLRAKNDKFRPDPANEQFFRDLDSYVQLFRTKEQQLQQGLNFYKKFDQKMNELNRNITDFLMARDMDKNELIKYILNGGSNSGGGRGYQENKDYDQDRGFNGFWDFTKNVANTLLGFQGQNQNQNNNRPPEYVPPSQQFNNNNNNYGRTNQGGYGGQNQGGYGGQNQYGGSNQGGYGGQNQGGYGGQNQYGGPNQGGYGGQYGGPNQGGYGQNNYNQGTGYNPGSLYANNK